MHFGLFLADKKIKNKDYKNICWIFPLGSFGHSKSKILHCAGPHPLDL